MRPKPPGLSPGYRFADGATTDEYADVQRRLLRETQMTATNLLGLHAGRVYTHESTVDALGFDRAHAMGFGDLYRRLNRIP